MNAPKCPRCRVSLRMGFAIVPTLEGIPDFPGDRHPVTVSASGPGKLASCLKCPSCGYSTTFARRESDKPGTS